MSKRATFVGPGKRSQQFYGLRRSFDWKVSAKTRDPVRAMQMAWGDDLDVIMLMALTPTAPNRGWERYDEEYEVVDLGRNHKEAKHLLHQLEVEARRESAFRDRLDECHIESVREEIRKAKKGNTEGLCESINHQGFFSALSDSIVRNEIKKDWFRWVLRDLDPEKETSLLRTALFDVSEGLHVEAVDNTGEGLYDLSDILRATVRRACTKKSVRVLTRWIERIDDVVESREKDEERREELRARKRKRKALDWMFSNGVGGAGGPPHFEVASENEEADEVE